MSYISGVLVFASLCSILTTAFAMVFVKSEFAAWYFEKDYVGLGVWVMAAVIAAVGLA